LLHETKVRLLTRLVRHPKVRHPERSVRREFVRLLAGGAFSACATPSLAGPESSFSTHLESSSESQRDRMLGLLYGGLIGDALGGPLEFSKAAASEKRLANVRTWDDERILAASDRERMSNSIPLHEYSRLRPDTAPYGPWIADAPAGTLTDDSRHKIVLLRALQAANEKERPLRQTDLAEAFLSFEPKMSEQSADVGTPQTKALNEEGFREYRYAARWLLGERDLELARPVERLWSGVNNCSGQMMFPPLSIRYSGEPEKAYRRTFELDFIDAPVARDFAAALNAGLAAALDADLDSASPQDRWTKLLEAMRLTDPYKFREVPFAGRQLDRWLDRIPDWLDRAANRPKVLFEILETEGKPVYWWDAHFTLIVPIAILHLCKFDPLAAMHLTLDFGHDTDSYAQVLGCMIGAVHGISVFPPSHVRAVRSRLFEEYGESLEQWVEHLTWTPEA
jgi:ADP-ribosylglycohydrolase